MDLAVQEGARGQHHGARAKTNAHLCDGASDAVTLDDQVIHSLLEQPQVGLVFQALANRGFVKNAVGLRAGGAHRRALGAVEDAKLDAALIGGQGHGATQGVDFLDQMAFANPANRGVATHLPQGFDVVAQQQGLGAHARGRQRRFGAGMAAAHHNDVKCFGIPHHTGPFNSSSRHSVGTPMSRAKRAWRRSAVTNKSARATRADAT